MPSEEISNAITSHDERFRIMADVAPVLIWLAGLDKLCYFFNQPWLEFTGRTMEQEMGNGWAEGVHPDDLERCLLIYTSAFDARRDFRMEYRLRRHDGVHRWILDTGRPIITEDGVFRGFIGSCIDIDDMKTTEERNRALQEQINQAQKMEAIGSLAAGLAHDLKNLLTVIQGNSELILSKTEAGTKVHEHADRITAASLRASEMMKKLLIFSRKQPLSRQWIYIRSVVENVLDLVRGLMPSGISIDYERPKELWAVNVDTGLIEQVLVNLMTNARDAIGDQGRITISLTNMIVNENQVRENANAALGNYILLEVADTGKGMTPEVMKHIFEPFYTTKAEGKGTGLGLSIVFGIIKEHGGWVDVSSVTGKGSRFMVYIPADPQVRLG